MVAKNELAEAYRRVHHPGNRGRVSGAIGGSAGYPRLPQKRWMRRQDSSRSSFEVA